MRVLFATAELAPLVRVGGLAEAAGGLVTALRRAGVELTVVLPDYADVPLAGEKRRRLAVPAWAGDVWTRTGRHEHVGELTLIGSGDLRRPHPYTDAAGVAWLDNDLRFMQFAAGIAVLRDESEPDVLHLNDWHTAAATALGETIVPTVLTIHTLGYQGIAPQEWLSVFTRFPELFVWYDQINPLAGGIHLADRVVAVSPNYAKEILRPETGMGLDEVLAFKGPRLVGILNGIDTDEWNPASDPFIADGFDFAALDRRDANRDALAALAGWEPGSEPVVGVVSRLVDQKGIDLLAAAVPYLAGMPARLFVLGSGLAEIAESLQAAAAAAPDRVFFHEGYDLALAHRIFAGADLFAMPSRFEPCGLAQMQAMRYGAIPVVTPVGGLVDTVIDADRDGRGTGFVSSTIDTAGIVDALHRGVRAYRNQRRRRAIQRRGMEHDWSWDDPARKHIALYEDLAATH